MLQVLLSQDVQLLLYFIHGLVSGVSHGLGLGLGFSHIVELWFWCLQGPSLSLGGCWKFSSPRIYTYGNSLLDLVSGVSHGLGLGLLTLS